MTINKRMTHDVFVKMNDREKWAYAYALRDVLIIQNDLILSLDEGIERTGLSAHLRKKIALNRGRLKRLMIDTDLYIDDMINMYGDTSCNIDGDTSCNIEWVDPKIELPTGGERVLIEVKSWTPLVEIARYVVDMHMWLADDDEMYCLDQINWWATLPKRSMKVDDEYMYSGE